MQVKHQAIMETVARLLQFNHELSRAVLALVPSPDNPMYRDGKCWPALPQVWWYQYSLIFLRSPSLGPAVRGPAADGYVPHPRRAPRTGFCELPPVLLQRRERSRVAASITPRRPPQNQPRGSPAAATKLLPPVGTLQPVHQHPPPIWINRRQ
jgi:hypothetical protein